MQFNTFLCSGTKNFFYFFLPPTGFLIQCMTSRQRVLKVFRQRSRSCVSGQWQMSCRRSGSETALPWENHIALVSLQGWNSRRLGGEAGREGEQDYFHSAIWHRPLKPRTARPRRASRATKQWEIITPQTVCLGCFSPELAVAGRAGLVALCRRKSPAQSCLTRTWHIAHGRGGKFTGTLGADVRQQIHWLMTAREGDKMREKKTQTEEKSCHPLVLLIAAIKVFCFWFFFFVLCFRSVRNSPQKLLECGRAHLVIGYASKRVSNRS